MAVEPIRYLSLFSGIEATTLAFHSLNYEPVAFAEIEPFCCELLAHRYPDIPNLGDVSHINEERLCQLGRIDLVVFGSPCQDLSVAGLRKGLDGERSGLFRAAVRIIRLARQHCQCRFALWENVPGTFSSNKGRDFSEVLQLFTGCSQPTPDKGWQTSGAAYGPESLIEWRVLDAQYTGVPQRRRRVFALADFGDWTSRQPVLFEPESLPRNFEKSRTQRQDIAGPLEARTSAGGFPGTDGACANHIIFEHLPNTIGTIDSECGCSKLNHKSMLQGHVLPVPYDLQAHGKYGSGNKASSLKQRDWKDATDLIVSPVIPIHDQATRHSGKRADKRDGKGNGLGIGQPDSPMNTLTSGDQHAVCFQQNQREEVRLMGGDGQTAGSLQAQPGMKNTNFLCQQYVVRRLTPIECERLQGMPDDWTKIPYKGKTAEHCPVTPRYKAIGNSMAVPQMHNIGIRLQDEIYARH